MKTIYRSQTDCKVAGVCGGIAERLNVDATFVRLFTAAAAVFSFGTVLVIYLAAWLLVPARSSAGIIPQNYAGIKADSPLMTSTEEMELRREIETLRARMAGCEPYAETPERAHMHF